MTTTLSYLRKAGPYVGWGLVLLLPGGSILALVLWLYQHKRQAPVGLGFAHGTKCFVGGAR
jgi:hypothetical protein